MIEIQWGALDGLDEMIQEQEVTFQEASFLILDHVGIQTVAYLKSLTSEMQPPVRKGEPPRRAHPGGWSDISGNLALAYQYETRVDSDGATLVFTNGMEYAAWLEAKDGYFVLSGVVEKGGPVEQAIREVVKRYTDWEIRD